MCRHRWCKTCPKSSAVAQMAKLPGTIQWIVFMVKKAFIKKSDKFIVNCHNSNCASVKLSAWEIMNRRMGFVDTDRY